MDRREFLRRAAVGVAAIPLLPVHGGQDGSEEEGREARLRELEEGWRQAHRAQRLTLLEAAQQQGDSTRELCAILAEPNAILGELPWCEL